MIPVEKRIRPPTSANEGSKGGRQPAIEQRRTCTGTTRSLEFSSKWERKYPAIVQLWTNAWPEFTPFLAFDIEIRKTVCTTNAIESLNARFRRAVNARGRSPTDQSALKILYLTITSLDPTGKGRARWSNRWKATLNAFDITFDGGISADRR